MKVELTPTITNQKTNLFTKVKKFVSSKLKPLTKDTFEKVGSTGKKEKNVIVSRKNPNCCDGPETQYRNNTIAKRVLYYPEDLEKMKTMTKEEQFKYKDYLDKIGRFYYDDNYHVDTPALDEFFKKYNIDINKYIIKDKK